MPDLANGILCFGPFFFVAASFTLSQLASRRCDYIDIPDGSSLNTRYIAESFGIWCYTVSGGRTVKYGEEWEAFDSTFLAARWCSIVNTAIGAIVIIFYIASGCVPCKPAMFGCVGLLLVLDCLLEALTFLVFQSETFCTGVDTACLLGTGGKCGVAACVLWFVSSLMTCATGKQAKQPEAE